MFKDRGQVADEEDKANDLELLRTANQFTLESWGRAGPNNEFTDVFLSYLNMFIQGVNFVSYNKEDVQGSSKDVQGSSKDTLCILLDESKIEIPEDKLINRDHKGNSSYSYSAKFDKNGIMIYRIPYKKIDAEDRLVNIMQRFAAHVGHSMLISNVKFSKSRKQLLTTSANLNKCEVFTLRRLMVNPNLHFLTPKHIKMSNDTQEYRKIRSYITADSGIPFQSDAISKWWGWNTGEIIKIDRDAAVPGSKDGYYYRIIGKSGSIAVSVRDGDEDEVDEGGNAGIDYDEIDEIDFMNVDKYEHDTV